MLSVSCPVESKGKIKIQKNLKTEFCCILKKIVGLIRNIGCTFLKMTNSTKTFKKIFNP